MRMIKYIVFNGKVEICSTREFSSVLHAACCVLRAARAACSMPRAACKCESNKGIHSLNFSSVLCAAACKYELAFKRLTPNFTAMK